MISVADAIASLRPGARWTLAGLTYDGLTWHEDTIAKPTKQEVDNEIDRLRVEAEATAYKALRAAEYPPITDYLDGVVKGDHAQIDAYIQACQAVKAKYPKPDA